MKQGGMDNSWRSQSSRVTAQEKLAKMSPASKLKNTEHEESKHSSSKGD